MGRIEEELKTYFKSHSKIREQKAHTSKVSDATCNIIAEHKWSIALQVHSVGWSCDGRRLASASFDKSVAVYTLERDRVVGVLMHMLQSKSF